MIGGGPGGHSRMIGREVLKPQNTSKTLSRLLTYFKPFWPVLLLVLILVVLSTWASVTTPDLTGQTVDCYFTSAAPSSFSTFTAGCQSRAPLQAAG